MSESKGIVIEEQELREMARSARGCIQHIYLHWSGAITAPTKTPTTCVWTGMGRCM